MRDVKTLPSVFDRIKAVFIDTLILVLLSYIASLLFDQFGITSQTIRIVVFIVIFVLYDPVFTSQLGGGVQLDILWLALGFAVLGITKISVSSMRWYVIYSKVF